MVHHDPELELYRGLMDQPEEYETGFDMKSIIGAVFVGFVMMPGAIYLGLVAGRSLGAAAEWTTIILFTEVARRSFVTLKRQEIYILFYIAAALTATAGGLRLAGGAFAWKMFEQYFIQSPAAKGMGIASEVPNWVVPPEHSPAILHRTFLHPDWILPGVIVLIGTVLGRLNWFGLGYLLFRLTSDYQQLPFPFAAIQAQGATALAEVSGKEETWRWKTFSIGAMIGLVFGVFYVGIPTLTGVLMTEPLQLIPIPWVDLTQNTEQVLPAAPVGFNTDLGTVIAGFVIPFWAVIGSAVSALGMLAINPLMYKYGVLTHWQAGMGIIETQFANQISFYFSFTIGKAIGIFLISLYTIGLIYWHKTHQREGQPEEAGSWIPPKGRGDFPLWAAGALFVVSTFGYIGLCRWLVPKFPILFVVFFGLILTPINSLVDAVMLGITGQWVGIPMVKEAIIIFSGYKGVDIWFAPIPNFDHGRRAMQFRVVELTGTRIPSLVKAELTVWPITIFCSLLFWQFVWRLAPVPSVYYPYAQKMWHLRALQRGLWVTSTMNPEKSMFMRAWNKNYVYVGLAFSTVLYTILAALKLPVLLVFGMVRGLGRPPTFVVPELAGALVSQFYFIPRYGARRWKQYATVIMAGYSCGMGLIGMGSIALAMIGKSVSQMPY